MESYLSRRYGNLNLLVVFVDDSSLEVMAPFSLRLKQCLCESNLFNSNGTFHAIVR